MFASIKSEDEQAVRVRKVLLAVAAVVGVLFLAFLALVWWGSRVPRRPTNISPLGVFLERGAVPFELSMHGEWLDCWQDVHTNTDQCRLTDEKGIPEFEGTFVPYEGKAIIPLSELKIDATKTGHLWMGVIPVIFLQNGIILLPKSDYEESKKTVDFWVYGGGKR